jgi:predicted dienelactone hydrolase
VLGVSVAVALLASSVGAVRLATPGRQSVDGVTERSETFVDTHRGTPAVPPAHLKAKKTRTLKTLIWYPSAVRGRLPLIVFAHGCGGNARDDEPLLREWAAAGTVVAAPNFPISSVPTPGVACVSDTVNQPGDVSFVISQVLALDRARHGLGHIVDRSHIGVAGHSLGGVTTLGVAFRSCCRDRRITAAIAFAGTPLLRGTDFRGIRTPLLLVHGDADPTVRYSASAASFNKAEGPHYLLTIIGGTHGSYLETTNAAFPAVLHATLDFWAGYLRSDRVALDRLASDAVIPGTTSLQTGM